MPPTNTRRSIRRWAFRLFLCLIPLCAAWWLGGAHYFLRLMNACANSVMPRLLFDNVASIQLMDNQSWKIITSLEIIGAPPTEPPAEFMFDIRGLMHSVLGFPLLWSLLISTTGWRFKRLAAGTLLLATLSFLCQASQIWATLTVLVNHRANILGDPAPPPFSVFAMPYPSWAFHLSSYAYYLSVLVLPVMSPIVIWVMLCQRRIARIVINLRHHRQTQHS